MSFHYRKEVISPEVLQELYSLTPEQKTQKEIRDHKSAQLLQVNRTNFY